MTVHVACAADRAWAPHSAATMHSVLAHAGGEPVEFHYLHGPDFPRSLRRRLRRMVGQADAAIEFHEISERMTSGLPVSAPMPVATWYRLFVPSLVGAERLLFLDADVVVLEDVRPLAHIDLGDAWVAGVEDLFALRMGYRKLLGIEGRQGYFNAGVLVLDLRALRDGGMDSALITEARRLAPWLFCRDQDALNVTLGKRRLPLHPRWNLTWGLSTSRFAGLVFDEATLREARERPAIRHFTGTAKPWSDDERPADAGVYWEHRAATPFARA